MKNAQISQYNQNTQNTQNNPININLISQNNLRECCLVTDGNSHCSKNSNGKDLIHKEINFTHQDLLCEAMLPEIRTMAMLIAAERHDFNQNQMGKNKSPEVFTEDADWFAARILVLKARVFHLDIRMIPMLNLANERAQAFAKKHNFPFQVQEAVIRPSLHSKRPDNMLLMECDLHTEVLQNMFENTQSLRKIVFRFA